MLLHYLMYNLQYIQMCRLDAQFKENCHLLPLVFVGKGLPIFFLCYQLGPDADTYAFCYLFLFSDCRICIFFIFCT